MPVARNTPVRVIVIRDTLKPELALITTDLTATPAQIVERYADRWAIEVCFEEAKHQAGVGDARNRTQRAVKRTVPFQFFAMTLTIIWYALHGHHPQDVQDHRDTAPWYRSKPSRPSPTCSPSSDARSSPTNIHPDGSAPPTNRKSLKSSKHGQPDSAETAKVEISRTRARGGRLARSAER